MLTCFVRTEFTYIGQQITAGIFLAAPALFLSFCAYLTISMYRSNSVRKDPKVRSMYFRYIIYSTVYAVFNTPMFLLYFLSLFSKIEPDTFLSWLSFVNYFSFQVSCIMNVSVQVVLCLLRIYQGYMKIDIFSLCRKRARRSLTNPDESLLRQDGQSVRTVSRTEFHWLENNMMQNVSAR